jgi:hypothetical protein
MYRLKAKSQLFRKTEEAAVVTGVGGLSLSGAPWPQERGLRLATSSQMDRMKCAILEKETQCTII